MRKPLLPISHRTPRKPKTTPAIKRLNDRERVAPQKKTKR